MNWLNQILRRPVLRWDPGAMSNQMNVGHLYLDKNDCGYMICEIISPSGGEVEWSPRLGAGEMNTFISGIEKGISLKTVAYNAFLK